LGMRRMIEVIKREAPGVEIGNFTRPVKKAPGVGSVIVSP
jgi:hypothetical protein